MLEDNDFHPDEGLVTSTDHPVEESTADDGIHTSVEGREGILRASTEKTYNSYRKKLAGFLGTAFDGKKILPKEMFTDDNISRIVVQLGKNSSYVVSLYSFIFILYCSPILSSYSRQQYNIFRF